MIIAISFGLVVIPFIVIFLLKEPIEINDVMHQFSDPEYQSFMIIFISAFGLITLIFLIVAYIFKIQKPSDYIIINKDNNFRKYYQVNYKKNQSLFITENGAFYYNKLTNQIRKISDYREIQVLKGKYIFWLIWDDIIDYRVIKKNKKTILIFSSEKSRIVLNYRYYFPISKSSLPEEITEIISNKSPSRNSIQSFYTYYFTDNNRQLSIKHSITVFNALNSDY
ncbi:MAG: hypothetical protein RQ856_06535 [Candidatus Izemoplasmatales bacterium]|nr:hypothetical protein [Candidatus Izemoplasmatales bacterium]